MESDTLDTTGLICPLPILRLKKKMNNVEEGIILKLITTDKASAEDIPAFCSLTGNRLIDSLQQDNTWAFWIKKGE